jgi:hypothetical protein
MTTYRGGWSPFYSSPAPFLNIPTPVIVAARRKAVVRSHGRSEGWKLACENSPAIIEIIGCRSDVSVILLIDSEC